MSSSHLVIVCFAVKEEARFFNPHSEPERKIRTVLTGMGQRNAENVIRNVLSEQRPGLVLTCGFAGGLNPEFERGRVIFSEDGETHLHSALLASGATPALFHCAEQVATTAAQKRNLRQTTGADAVEMESGIICNICRAYAIPSGTVRVVLDTSDDDLPLDFNKLMTADQRMDYGKLAMSLLRSPGKIPALLRLQKQATAAAQKLAMVLNRVLLR